MLVNRIIFLLPIYPHRVYNDNGGYMSKIDRENYQKRLKRINGQVQGIMKMIDNERCCEDILIQISAVESALKSLGKEILLEHMETCMVQDIKKGNMDSIKKAIDLCGKLV